MQNAKRCIRRLRGKVADLLQKMKKQSEITAKAAELVEAYKCKKNLLFYFIV